MSPGRALGRDAKCTRRLSRARPVIRWVAPSLRPSPSATSTSTDAADQGAVLGPGDLVLQRDQPLVPLLDDLLGHLAVHGRRRRARPDRVLERERAGEPRAPHHVEGVLEVGVGLAGEPDDDVGGDGGVRHRGPDPLDDAEVPLAAVRAAHRACSTASEPDCSGMCSWGITVGVWPWPR